jgi:NAD-dependent DNA ligase
MDKKDSVKIELLISKHDHNLLAAYSKMKNRSLASLLVGTSIREMQKTLQSTPDWEQKLLSGKRMG